METTKGWVMLLSTRTSPLNPPYHIERWWAVQKLSSITLDGSRYLPFHTTYYEQSSLPMPKKWGYLKLNSHQLTITFCRSWCKSAKYASQKSRETIVFIQAWHIMSLLMFLFLSSYIQNGCLQNNIWLLARQYRGGSKWFQNKGAQQSTVLTELTSKNQRGLCKVVRFCQSSFR